MGGLRSFKIESGYYTKRDTDSINSYFAEVKRIPLLSVEDELEYAILSSKGNKEARDMLVKSNLRFVISVAKQSLDKSVLLEDLINEGNRGLIQAAEKFDHTKGFKFISYAVWYIRRYIDLYKKEHGKTIKLPINRICKNNHLEKLMDKIEQELQYRPDYTDLILDVDYSLSQLKEFSIFRDSDNVSSLDKVLTNDGADGSSLLECIEDKDAITPDLILLENEKSVVINKVLNNLTPRLQEIIKLTYGLDGNQCMGLTEIGERLGISKERVRTLRDCTLRKLKYTIYKEQLAKDYFMF